MARLWFTKIFICFQIIFYFSIIYNREGFVKIKLCFCYIFNIYWHRCHLGVARGSLCYPTDFIEVFANKFCKIFILPINYTCIIIIFMRISLHHVRPNSMVIEVIEVQVNGLLIQGNIEILLPPQGFTLNDAYVFR